MKWAEHSLRIRQREEPNLLHLNEWLQARVLAMKEAYPAGQKPLSGPPKGGDKEKFTGATGTTPKGREEKKCPVCKDGNHLFWWCNGAWGSFCLENLPLTSKKV